MSQRPFSLAHRLNSHNLHIYMRGEFDTQAAQCLLDAVQNNYKPNGRIFIDTREVTFSDAGIDAFKRDFINQHVVPSSVYFKGEQGFALAPSGCRVLIVTKRSDSAPQKQHVCCGKCKHCTCGGRCGGKSRAA